VVRGEKARCTDAEHHWELELGHSDCHFQGHFVGTLDSNGLVERCVKFEDAFFLGGDRLNRFFTIKSIGGSLIFPYSPIMMDGDLSLGIQISVEICGSFTGWSI